MMFFQDLWKKPGVYNVEQFDPDPFLKALAENGLPWQEFHNIDLEL
ncbi:MAG: saccharopine dehydrogenase family protein, partial [Bacteroidales bacterium]|nr:saccharopine dehydrogenase family protein [Bacteroidales bacterium]